MDEGGHLPSQSTIAETLVLVADDFDSTDAAANIDPRSFNINDENNLHVISRFFSREQIGIIENDLGKCREITLDNFDG